jgi:hypothetical protein
LLASALVPAQKAGALMRSLFQAGLEGQDRQPFFVASVAFFGIGTHELVIFNVAELKRGLAVWLGRVHRVPRGNDRRVIESGKYRRRDQKRDEERSHAKGMEEGSKCLVHTDTYAHSSARVRSLPQKS